MINVKSAAARPLPFNRRFWLLNLLLLVLYIWTLTESATVSISVRPGRCTAHTPERRITISCSGLYRGFVALYSTSDPTPDFLQGGPLDWLAPTSAWGQVRLLDAAGSLQWQEDFNGTLDAWEAQQGLWRARFGELRPPEDPGLFVRRQPLPERRVPFEIQARLHRPYDNAGLLLLQADGQEGWVFITTSSERRGSWWRWEDGRVVEPLAGIPYQKPALAQLQSLLRRVLIAHQAALLLLAAAWLLREGWRRLPPVHGLPALPGGRFLPALLALIIFALTVHIAVDVLQGVPHVQDSITYLFQAQTLARGHLAAPAPPLPEAFEQEFLLVRDGRWFGKYPPGYPAVLALGVLAGAPWIVNPLLATLVAPLLYALARRLAPGRRGTALLAAALPLASPFFLFMSGSHMAHPAELVWMLLFMVLVVRIVRAPRAGRAALGAGLALGALFLTRQLSAVAGALPFLGAVLLSLQHARWGGSRTAPTAGRRLPVSRPPSPVSGLLSPVLRISLTALPFLLLLLAHQWALTGDPLQDPRLLFWDYDHVGLGQDIGEGQNAFELAMTPEGLAQIWYHDPSQPPRGHSVARGLYNTQENWLALERDLFGWLPALTLGLVWLAFLLGARREDWMLLAPFVTLLGAYVFYWADGISYGPRYFYVALPGLLLLTARGARKLARALGPGGTPAVATLLVVLVGGAYVLNGPNYLEAYRGYNFVSGENLALIEQEAQAPALVFVEPGTDWWHYGSVFSANTPWLDGPIVAARDLGPRANERLRQHFAERRAYVLTGEGLEGLEALDAP